MLQLPISDKYKHFINHIFQQLQGSSLITSLLLPAPKCNFTLSKVSGKILHAIRQETVKYDSCVAAVTYTSCCKLIINVVFFIFHNFFPTCVKCKYTTCSKIPTGIVRTIEIRIYRNASTRWFTSVVFWRVTKNGRRNLIIKNFSTNCWLKSKEIMQVLFTFTK